MKDYKEILEGVVNIINTTEKSDIGFANICAYIGENCPELAEPEDEKIRKSLIDMLKNDEKCYLKEIAWLEKQGTPAKLSEEEQNRFAKGILTSCAMSFIDYLDAHKYEGKMCVSNGECEDIENAFHNAMWDKLHRYYGKYIEKQGEQILANSAKTCKDEQNHWSEVDNFMYNRIKNLLTDISLAPESINSLSDWLKDLKDRYTWKPSEDQIMALRWVLNHIPYDSHKEEISGLLEQLKKLK